LNLRYSNFIGLHPALHELRIAIYRNGRLPTVQCFTLCADPYQQCDLQGKIAKMKPFSYVTVRWLPLNIGWLYFHKNLQNHPVSPRQFILHIIYFRFEMRFFVSEKLAYFHSRDAKLRDGKNATILWSLGLGTLLLG
jgi:hypothetical protein